MNAKFRSKRNTWFTDTIRKVSFNPHVRALVRGLGLTGQAQKLYFRFMQEGATASYEVAGINATFFSSGYLDRRSLDSWIREPALARLIELVEPDDVVLDVGANRGVYSILLASKARRVIAVEPEAASSSQLLRNKQMNGLNNLDVYQRAFGNREGTETLYLGLGVAAIDTGHLGRDWKQSETQSVELVRGDDFLRDNGLPQPTIIKIDVEGYEDAVLAGLEQTLKHCRVVLCEIHPDMLPSGVTPDKVIDRLRNAGLESITQEPCKTEIHAMALREVATQVVRQGNHDKAYTPLNAQRQEDR